MCRALINDVLDLSKIEAGKMEIESVQFNIRDEIDEILLLFVEKESHMHLEMAALIHDAVPSCLLGDPTRIRQVWPHFLLLQFHWTMICSSMFGFHVF